MQHKGRLAAGIVIAIIVAAIIFGIISFNLSALPEPGHFETSMATHAKDWYIGRAARGSLPAAPASTAAAISAGNALFSMECVSCHGQNGRTPTPIGKAMYPRALNLGSSEVQGMSDRELFWVVKNGIRLSGMPGFGRINSDQELWQLTYYVRSLGNAQK